MRAFRVGPWTAHPHRHELQQDDQRQRVGAKVMAALCCLAAEAGRVVRKDDLIQQVWSGDFASDEALSAVIYELRKALGDDARNPRFVETIRKSGFRLIAPVSLFDESGAPNTNPELEREPKEGSSLPILASRDPVDLGESPTFTSVEPTTKNSVRAPKSPRRRMAMALALVFLAALALLSLSRRPPVSAAPEVRSLAVLPVSTFGPEAKELFMAEALTEMLISDLAQSSPLEITSGLSIRSQPRTWNLDRIATELAVDAVLEGSVLRSGDRYWISIQLVETGTGRLLWGASYDRQGPDSLAVMRGVALDVARQVEGLLPSQ